MIPGRSSRKFVLLVMTLLLHLLGARAVMGAAIQFASPFVDHMVIQRGKPIPVWGVAPASTTVVVQFGEQKTQVAAGADGRWQIALAATPAGGPFTLTANSPGQTVSVSDVLIGDVWLCSGQSNMQFSMQECNDAQAVLNVAHPRLRLGKVDSAWTAQPQSTAKVRWAGANADEAKSFSAVAYTFAHELESDPAMADIPIGILEDCLGGTVIESWLPKSALSGFDSKTLQSSMFGIGPTLLYNGMIAPLGNTAFTGVIWYQGEGNAGEPERYSKLLPLLFQSWRSQFQDPTLPFLVVQLPDYAADWGGIYWQWMREAEAKAVAATPHTAIAVTLNTNDGWNLHPQGKHEVGRRLALLARQQVYGERVVGAGPEFKSAKVNGSELVLSFDTNGDGLSSGTGPVNGFMIAGDDGVYHVAQAAIDGETVVLQSADVAAPKTVRYGWAGVPHCSLTNKSGLPAAPFRTDAIGPVKGLCEPQLQPPGFVFRGQDFLIDVSNEGRLTNLACRYQQFLSNAPGNWGGAGFSNRSLAQVTSVGPQTILCTGNDATFTIEATPTGMRWTIKNLHQKESAKFDIALSSGVEVSGDPGGPLTLNSKGVQLHLTGTDRITQYHDVSAEDGKVLEVELPAGAVKSLSLDLK